MVLAAGTLTSAWVSTVGIYLCLKIINLDKLISEIEENTDNPDARVTLATINRLPYLRACAEEAIRLGYGAPGCANRLDLD